ncbi:MAG: hypothetical protein BEN18_05675 [Epulopiscium sp. Nuni2H_MBin001]|nr:MAG: hypothetical protein BEN18_05675 [Epulopiscium sp. Nuni2H_MBin001]
MEVTKLYDKYCIDFNQNFFTLTKAELDDIKAKLTDEQIAEMKEIVDEIFTYDVQSVTFNRPDFVKHLDKHQYFSLSSYFYPDESDASKPWVRKDGQVNPESILYAKQGLRKTSMVVNLASLMYYITGEDKYKDVLVKHLDSFFINPDTRMLPNLNYSQMVTNHPEWGKGRGFGIIDFGSNMGYGFLTLKHLYDEGMLGDDVYAPLQKWISELLVWLETSPIGLEERDAPNNHGVLYTLLLTQLHYFVGDLDKHKDELLKQINSRLDQIEEDGSLPEELLRTRALAYTAMALKGFLDTYKLLGEDFSQQEHFRKAFEFILPVLNNSKKIGDILIEDKGIMRPCVQMDGTYPEYYKFYLSHLGKDFGINLQVISNEGVHYKYMFN